MRDRDALWLRSAAGDIRERDRVRLVRVAEGGCGRRRHRGEDRRGRQGGCGQRGGCGQYGERLAGKIIVDPTNPVGPDADGNYRKVIPEQESSGQILAGLLPTGARLVKAFGTLSAPTLSAVARQAHERAVLCCAADDDEAGDLVAGLIRVNGYEPVQVGGLDQAIRIEMFGDPHEYGALGRAVTKTEALAAV